MTDGLNRKHNGLFEYFIEMAILRFSTYLYLLSQF